MAASVVSDQIDELEVRLWPGELTGPPAAVTPAVAFGSAETTFRLIATPSARFHDAPRLSAHETRHASRSLAKAYAAGIMRP